MSIAHEELHRREGTAWESIPCADIQGEHIMQLSEMSREALIEHIREMDEYLDNVIVLWGGKKQLRETLGLVAKNADEEFNPEEAAYAATILKTDGVFEEFIEMLRESFDRGGINFAISEKMSAIMQTVAEKHRA
jgi:secreted Zn-dependent insulinase-like peptidase